MSVRQQRENNRHGAANQREEDLVCHDWVLLVKAECDKRPLVLHGDNLGNAAEW